MQYLRIKNWEEFQHYKDRNPPWIKLHRALLDNYDFCSLPDTAKAHLMLIWIHGSQNDGVIAGDKKFLERKLSCEGIDLELLIERGFLIVETASSPIAACEGLLLLLRLISVLAFDSCLRFPFDAPQGAGFAFV